MARIGVFGGTFDPPHVGHFIVAQDVAEVLGLDTLLLMPAAVSPHKKSSESAPAETRARMLEVGLGVDSRLRLSRIEVDRGGVSYTVDTLRALSERSPGDELMLVIGADQLGTFSTWRSPAEVLRLASLVVMDRGGVLAKEAAGGSDVSYRAVPVTRVDVSSTEVRRRRREGRSIRYWVPEPVRRIIEEEGLYIGS
jgi:nicotinate-nucleotide adenylyltransferase